VDVKNNPGPCMWNGSEIVRVVEPSKGIAGIAHDVPEEWGPLFAAAPEMYEALNHLYRLHCEGAFSLEDKDYIAITKAAAALAKAEGKEGF